MRSSLDQAFECRTSNLGYREESHAAIPQIEQGHDVPWENSQEDSYRQICQKRIVAGYPMPGLPRRVLIMCGTEEERLEVCRKVAAILAVDEFRVDTSWPYTNRNGRSPNPDIEVQFQ